MVKSEDKRFKIAHSQYFGKDIMCVKYHSDDDWYFCFVDKERQPTSGIYKAQSKHSCFFWHS